MNRFAYIISILTVFLLALNTRPVFAEQFGDISITVHTHSQGDSFHGYYEHRMTIFNHSRSASHRVTIELPFENRSARGNYIRSLRRTVAVAPRTKANVSIFQPPLQVRGNQGKVSVDGIASSQSLDIRRVQHGGFSQKMKVVLVSRSLNRDNLDSQLKNLHRGPKKKKTSKKRKEILVRAEHDTRMWSTHWLGYSRYDGIMMQVADWNTAPEAVKAALASYVKTGGTLTFLGKFETFSLPGVAYMESRDDMIIYTGGFGRLIVIPVDDVNALNNYHLKYLIDDWRITQLPFGQINGETAANNAFPIINDFDINLKALLWFMLIFVVLAGPLNLFILHRQKKKIWLVWTFPIIALLTAASVFGFAILSEGLDADVKISGITLLDQTSHEATTLGMAAFYCRMTPADGLRFSFQTELTPLVFRGYSRAGAARSIDLTSEQHFTSGWITARVPAHFMVRKIEKRRERIQVTWQSDGRPVVVNGLGAPIDRLFLADTQGKVYSGRQIPVGARVILDDAFAHVDPSISLEKFLRPAYIAFAKNRQLEWLQNKEQTYVTPNTYVAQIDGCPFIEKGLTDPDNLELNAIIFGVIAPSDGNAKN